MSVKALIRKGGLFNLGKMTKKYGKEEDKGKRRKEIKERDKGGGHVGLKCGRCFGKNFGSTFFLLGKGNTRFVGEERDSRIFFRQLENFGA